MKRLSHVAYAATALAAPLLLTVTTPAAVSAVHVDTGLIQGSGTITPGLGASTTPQAMSFAGTLTAVSTRGVGATYGCAWAGDWITVALAGVGAVAGACGPIVFETCVGVLAGPALDLVCQRPSTGVSPWEIACVFRPHQTNPVTSYDLTCAIAGAE